MIICVVILGLFPRLATLSVSTITNYSPGSPALSALLLLAIYCVKSVTIMVPLPALYISAGVMFPMPWSLIITCVCMCAQMSISYFVGSRMNAEKLDSFVNSSKNKTLLKLLEYRNKNSVAACLFARMLPLPFDIFSMCMGASAMPFGSYIVFSLLGSAPKMIPFLIAGSAAANPLSKEFIAPFAISAALSVGAMLIYKFLIRLRRGKSLAD